MLTIYASKFSLFQPGNVAALEDELSVKTHIAAMQKEFAKASPNVLNIADSMERTFAARQKWIAEECPSVADIFEAYPALSEVKEVFLEFQRITSVHLQELEALAERHMPTLLRLAGKKVEGVSLKLLAKAATVPDGGCEYQTN